MGGISSLFQVFFHWLYHQGAWAYDGVAALVSGGRWVHWVTRALDHIHGERVLEIGFGPGHLLTAMARRGLRPVGIDRSPAMARQAHRRVGCSVPLVQGQAQALPFRRGSFDTVVTTFPAPFILEPATWREAARVLRPGGRFVVLWGAWPSGRTPWAWALRILFRWAVRPDAARPGEQFRTLAQEAGLRLQEWSVWDEGWQLWGALAVRDKGCPGPEDAEKGSTPAVSPATRV
ncbi:MAG TPA: class I SAM-dependent methyltransferase [Thermoflexus sp.]|nr:class I SAM-dependent methyltransferase [Thermoflexus sp.]